MAKKKSMQPMAKKPNVAAPKLPEKKMVKPAIKTGASKPKKKLLSENAKYNLKALAVYGGTVGAIVGAGQAIKNSKNK